MAKGSYDEPNLDAPFKESKPTNKKNTPIGFRVLLVFAVIIAVVALVVCLAPLKEVAYTVTVDYQDTETYYETESYNTPLSYEVIQSYTEDTTFQEHHQIIIGGVVFQDEIVDVPIQVAYIEIKNTDSVSGTFNVTFSVTDPYISELLAQTVDLAPNEVATIDCPSYSLGDWSYTVTPSTKTEYTQVEKQRTVTKQRHETRYKKVTLLDYLLHY